MRLIVVKAFERRSSDDTQTKQLIAALTDAMAGVYGDDVRAETWVIVEGVSPSRWGFGGEVRA
jgi:4-oxalocrotonate tautomerase